MMEGQAGRAAGKQDEKIWFGSSQTGLRLASQTGKQEGWQLKAAAAASSSGFQLLECSGASVVMDLFRPVSVT